MGQSNNIEIAFMAGAAGQAGDADSSLAPGLTSGLQGSVNIHRILLQKITPMKNCDFCEDMSKSKNANRALLIIYLD